MTTEPAPITAHDPITTPQTMVALAPIEAPWHTRVSTTSQSSLAGPGEPVVGEHGAGPDEHLVVEPHAPIDRNVVLDLGAVADHHPGIDEDVLAERGRLSNHRPGPHVGVVPDHGAGTAAGAVLDHGGVVDECRFGHGQGDLTLLSARVGFRGGVGWRLRFDDPAKRDGQS